MREHTKVKPK